MIIKNITKCPFDDEAAKIFGENNSFITNLAAEDGTNWYACMGQFAAETIKFAFNSSGVITSPGVKDVSSLTPINMSVAEVDESLYPAACSTDGTWKFDESTQSIYQDAETVVARALANNTMEFNRLLRGCTDAAFPLQSALALGVITPQQQEMLTELQSFAINLANTDLTQSPVAWPVPPASIW